MAWSTLSGRPGNKTFINKNSFRVVLLLALAWIVVYNFLDRDARIEEVQQDVYRNPGRTRTRPHRVNAPEVEVLAGGPQVGRVELDVIDSGKTAIENEHQLAIPAEHAAAMSSGEDDLEEEASEANKTGSAKGSAGSSSAKDSSAKAPVEDPLKDNVDETSSASAKAEPSSKAEAIESPTNKWIKTLTMDAADPITRLALTRPMPASTSLLALVMTRDASSWGSNGGPARTFASYLSMLSSSGLNLSSMALGILTSSQTEFDLYRTVLETDADGLGGAMVILHPGYASRKKEGEVDGDYRLGRHNDNIQHDRRQEMARLRNYLQFTALGIAPEARNIAWIDADVYELSADLLPSMIAKMDAHEEVGVLTVISHFGGGGDYDLNAYRLGRSSPNEEQRKKLRTDIGSWVAGMQGGHHIHHVLEKLVTQQAKEALERAGEGAFDPTKAEFDLSKRTDDRNDPWWQTPEVLDYEGLFRLDSVGATVVLLKTSLVNQGLAFATSYLVGTDWESEGWDAIESEGLCVTARTLGARCYAMVEGFSRHCFAG